MALKITYDPMANAMYIYFREKLSVAYSKEVSDGVIVDFDEEGNPLAWRSFAYLLGTISSKVLKK